MHIIFAQCIIREQVIGVELKPNIAKKHVPRRFRAGTFLAVKASL
jgi:hypothetical protein